MTVHQAARLLVAIVMALATAAAVWLVVPPLARRIITGDYGWYVVPTDARSGLWYPTAAWQPLTDPEILTLWVAAAGAALLVCLTTLRLMGGRR